MSSQSDIIFFIRKHLPPQAEVLFFDETPKHPLIIVADLDGHSAGSTLLYER